MALSSLPFDVCDRLLTSLPDFQTLRCTVLTSKNLQEAYEIHKGSIRYAVAFNEVGTALEHALLLVRVMINCRRDQSENQDFNTMVKWLLNDDPHHTFFYGQITPEEAHELTSVSSTVRRLEVLFTVRFLNREATTSLLNEEERHRFHRALYRLWIIDQLDVIVDRDDLYPSEDETRDLFMKFKAKEIFELQEAIHFLHAIYSTWDPNPSRYPVSPRTALYLFYAVRAVKHRAMPYTRHVIQNWVSNFDLNEQEAGDRKVICEHYRIDSISSCDRCGESNEELFCENNWDWFSTPTGWSLPGRLASNVAVLTMMDKYYNNKLAVDMSPIIKEMFEILNDVNNADADWIAGATYCQTCLELFVSEHLYSWLVSRLLKDGHNFGENCWYGWNCRTQAHKVAHANRLNHLCEPGRRDDTNMAATLHSQLIQIHDEDDDDEAEGGTTFAVVAYTGA